jgi:hypothetical protein
MFYKNQRILNISVVKFSMKMENGKDIQQKLPQFAQIL